ncbi:hypothetical protein Tco_0449439 [Tanacetum coccineum]
MFDGSSRFICENLQFIWSQTSHTESFDKILKTYLPLKISKKSQHNGITVPTKNNSTIHIFNMFLYEVISDIDVLVEAIICELEFSSIRLCAKARRFKDTYSAFAKDIEVQSCFLDDQAD